MIFHSKCSTWLDPALCNYCIYRFFAAQLDEHSVDPYYIVYTASWMTTVKWLKKWIVASQHAVWASEYVNSTSGSNNFSWRTVVDRLIVQQKASPNQSPKTSRKKRQKADPSQIFTEVGPFRGMAPLCIYLHVLSCITTRDGETRNIKNTKNSIS